MAQRRTILGCRTRKYLYLFGSYVYTSVCHCTHQLQVSQPGAVSCSRDMLTYMKHFIKTTLHESNGKWLPTCIQQSIMLSAKVKILLLLMSLTQAVHRGVLNVLTHDGGSFKINNGIRTLLRKLDLLSLSVLLTRFLSLQLQCLFPLSDTCKYLFIFYSQWWL